MKFVTVISCLMVINSTILFSQEETQERPTEDISVEKESPLTISGSVDAYYRANVGADHNMAPATSFANLPGFSLGMVNLVASKEWEKVGFTADLVLGPRGEDATFLSPKLRPNGNSSIVNQLYVHWQFSDIFKVTLGNFNTFLGYEVISPTSNFNYSTSYLFSYGPFSHTGLKVDMEHPSGFSVMAGIFNPTDATEYNPSNEFVGGAQLGYSFEKGNIYLNTLFDDDFFQIDITAGLDITDKIYIGLNASSASDAFYGAAIYLQSKLKDNLSLGTRFEYFYDNGIEVIGLEENIIDWTLSANYKIGALTIIPEYRIDFASQEIFLSENKSNKSMSSFLMAVVYGF